MVCLRMCTACIAGDHKNCRKSEPAPEGVYGGFRCLCKCDGDPHFGKPPTAKQRKKNMETLMKHLKAHIP